jgi:hypothetical protein
MKKRMKSEELREMNRRFWVVVAVGVAILVLITLIDHYLTKKYGH